MLASVSLDAAAGGMEVCEEDGTGEAWTSSLADAAVEGVGAGPMLAAPVEDEPGRGGAPHAASAVTTAESRASDPVTVIP